MIIPKDVCDECLHEVKLTDHRYVYVVVRVDIPIQHQMAQACHAALEAGKEFPDIIDEPDSLIVLQVENQEELNRAADLDFVTMPSPIDNNDQSRRPTTINNYLYVLHLLTNDF